MFKVDYDVYFRKVKYVFFIYIIEEFKIWSERKYFCKCVFLLRMILSFYCFFNVLKIQVNIQ